MRSHDHDKSDRKFRAAAIVLVLMAGLMIGLGIVGDASAIDDPRQQRKVEKKKGTVAPKRAPGQNQTQKQVNPKARPKGEPQQAPTNVSRQNPKGPNDKGDNRRNVNTKGP